MYLLTPVYNISHDSLLYFFHFCMRLSWWDEYGSLVILLEHLPYIWLWHYLSMPHEDIALKELFKELESLEDFIAVVFLMLTELSKRCRRSFFPATVCIFLTLQIPTCFVVGCKGCVQSYKTYALTQKPKPRKLSTSLQKQEGGDALLQNDGSEQLEPTVSIQA